jgi:hypothetical protein
MDIARTFPDTAKLCFEGTVIQACHAMFSSIPKMAWPRLPTTAQRLHGSGGGGGAMQTVQGRCEWAAPTSTQTPRVFPGLAYARRGPQLACRLYAHDYQQPLGLNATQHLVPHPRTYSTHGQNDKQRRLSAHAQNVKQTRRNNQTPVSHVSGLACYMHEKFATPWLRIFILLRITRQRTLVHSEIAIPNTSPVVISFSYLLFTRSTRRCARRSHIARICPGRRQRE